MTTPIVATTFAAVTLAAAGAFALTQGKPASTAPTPPAGPAARPGDAPPAAQADGQGMGDFSDLVSALAASPGCLGVEVAGTMSGKRVIFAWFENKEAVKRWYFSDTHMQAMDQFFPENEAGKPLDDVPDNVAPIMAIASVTMAPQGQFKETSLPVSQIAIELYTPITGGLFLGGRFAPDGVKVKNMVDYTPAPAAAPAGSGTRKPAAKPD